MVNTNDVNIDLRLFQKEYRLQTFVKVWPFKGNCAAQKMAEAGFYCVTSHLEEPAAKCFVCEKELDGWNEQDIPYEEHKKHANSCIFIKKLSEGKTCKTLTIQDFLEMYKFLIETRMKKSLNTTLEMFSNFENDLKK